MLLIRLRYKTQRWEANLRVRQSWVPNTFPRVYLNSEPISLVVKSKGPSSKGRYIYGSQTIAKTRWRLPPCVHGAYQIGVCELNLWSTSLARPKLPSLALKFESNMILLVFISMCTTYFSHSSCKYSIVEANPQTILLTHFIVTHQRYTLFSQHPSS